jgi:hypothetical protein
MMDKQVIAYDHKGFTIHGQREFTFAYRLNYGKTACKR